MTWNQSDACQRIDQLVESVYHDRDRSNQLFQYVWTMVCVQRGLLRPVPGSRTDGDCLVLEETSTGRRRIVSRPGNLDPEMESLAVRALSRMIDLGVLRA